MRKTRNIVRLGPLGLLVAAVAGAAVALSGAPATAQEKIGVKGMVVDEQAQRAAGARVRAWDMDSVNPFSPVLDVLTDAQGRFEGHLPPGHYHVFVTKGLLNSDSGPNSAWCWKLTGGAEPLEVTIPLRQGGRVEGVVVRKEGGTPVAFATVLLDDLVPARTDLLGRFEFVGVGFGEHVLRAATEGLAASQVDVNIAGPDVVAVRIEMSKGFRVIGWVTDENGLPVEGALVREGGCSGFFCRHAKTNKEGRYELRSLSFHEKKGSVSISHRGFAPQWKRDLSPPVLGDVITVDFVLNRGFAVSGDVRGVDGQPIPGARVTYGSSGCNPYYASTETDGAGRFRLDKIGTDERDCVMVEAKGYVTARETAKPARGEAVPDLSFTLCPSGTVRGRVVDRDGKPIANATVRPARLGAGMVGLEETIPPVNTNKEGRFTVVGLPVKDAMIDISAQGYSDVRLFSVKPDAENEIALDPPGVIAGKVVEERTGRPVTAFGVKLDSVSFESRASGGSGASLRTAEPLKQAEDFRSNEGLFTLGGLASGAQYALVVSAETYAATPVKDVVAQPGEWKDAPLLVKLAKGSCLLGQVVDGQSGKPVADAEVSLHITERDVPFWCFALPPMDKDRWASFWKTQKTRADDRGRFEYPNVPEDGIKALLVRAPGYAPCLLEDVELGRPLRVELTRGGSILGSAKGVPNLDMAKAGVALRRDGFECNRVMVKEDGSFRVDHLPPGAYWLMLLDVWERIREAPAKVADGETTRIDFGTLKLVKFTGKATQAGKPLAGYCVTITPTSVRRQCIEIFADRQGRYEAELVPGEYDVRGEKRQKGQLLPGPPLLTAHHRVVLADKDTELNFEFHAGRIVGRVVDAVHGQPVGGVIVNLWRMLPADAPPEFNVWVSVRAGKDPVPSISYHDRGFCQPGLRAIRGLMPRRFKWLEFKTTQANGDFEMPDLSPGTYFLGLQESHDAIPCLLRDVILTGSTEVQRVTAKIDRRHALRVRLVDAETNRPVSSGRVLLYSHEGRLLRSVFPRRPSAEEIAQSPPGKSKSASQQNPPPEYEPIRTDADGMVHFDGIQPDQYGVWALASGYAARWVAPLASAPKAEATSPHVIPLEPTGTLVLKPSQGLLEGVKRPYLAYRLWDEDGRVVCPGETPEVRSALDTALTRLTTESAAKVVVDTLPVGRYTMAWEVHCGPERSRPFAFVDAPAVAQGKASFEIRKRQQTVVGLTR